MYLCGCQGPRCSVEALFLPLTNRAHCITGTQYCHAGWRISRDRFIPAVARLCKQCVRAPPPLPTLGGVTEGRERRPSSPSCTPSISSKFNQKCDGRPSFRTPPLRPPFSFYVCIPFSLNVCIFFLSIHPSLPLHASALAPPPLAPSTYPSVCHKSLLEKSIKLGNNAGAVALRTANQGHRHTV